MIQTKTNHFTVKIGQQKHFDYFAQQIAAWKLLYRVQHPARYVSRLQTIPSSDIELEFTMIDRQEARSDVARIDPAADRLPIAAEA
jgi:hypothetical protein